MTWSWMFLAGAVVGDVVGTYALDRSNRLRRLWPALASVAAYVVSIVAFGLALGGIATSVADAVFAAAGTLLVTVTAVVLLGERLGRRKVIGLALVTLGVVVLRLQDGS